MCQERKAWCNMQVLTLLQILASQVANQKRCWTSYALITVMTFDAFCRSKYGNVLLKSNNSELEKLALGIWLRYLQLVVWLDFEVCFAGSEELLFDEGFENEMVCTIDFGTGCRRMDKIYL